MKLRRVLPGMLAGAMVVTTVFSGNWSVQAEDSVPTPDYSYSFEDDDIGDATAIVTELSNYSGNLEFETEGKDGAAIRLGDYGLKLNKENIGTNYTVSMWVKPDGAIAENTPVLFLGYHDPENWLGIAGNTWGASAECKFWAHNGETVRHSTHSMITIPAETWTHLTVTGDGTTVKVYVDGEPQGTAESLEALNGENQDIYLGVNNWDAEFVGLVDEAEVYKSTLTDAEVYRLYDPSTSEEDKFAAEGFTVQSEVSTKIGSTVKLEVGLPAGVSSESATITFERYDDTIIEMASDGTITGVSAGNTTVTTKVTVGSTAKTADTAVTVSEDAEQDSYSYSFEGSIGDATAIVTKLGNYTGALAYDEDGMEGKAIRLGDYGLKLNKENIGTDYTVSMWVKPDGAIAGNTPVLFLGYHNPEKWLAVSGNSNSAECKYWANNGDTIRWTTHAAVTIPAGEWTNLTLTGEGTTVKIYVDGILMSTATSLEALNGENQDIYLGVSNWDSEFVGLVDEVEIHKSVLTEEEIQAPYENAYKEKLQAKVQEALTDAELLGTKNTALNNVKYNLSLPDDCSGLPITWSTDNETIVSNTGRVYNGAADQTATLTASVGTGILTVTKEFAITVKAIDKTDLNKAIAEAKTYNTLFYTTTTVKNLNTAVANAALAATQADVDKAAASIRQAINRLVYSDSYENPWFEIEAVQPTVAVTIEAGKTAKLFTLPQVVSGLVSVSYATSNSGIVTYQDGIASAKKPGTATITLTVSGKNGTSQKYQTLVTVSNTSGLNKVTAKAGKTSLAKGKTTKIAISYPATVKAKNPKATYKSSGAVSVNSSGKVTAKKSGTGKVTVTITIASTGEKITKTLSFKVGTINKTSLKKNKSTTLKVNGLSGTPTWKITKGASLAKLSKSKGKSVKLTAGKKKGTITVKAIVGGVTITQKIKIN